MEFKSVKSTISKLFIYLYICANKFGIDITKIVYPAPLVAPVINNNIYVYAVNFYQYQKVCVQGRIKGGRTRRGAP